MTTPAPLVVGCTPPPSTARACGCADEASRPLATVAVGRGLSLPSGWPPPGCASGSCWRGALAVAALLLLLAILCFAALCRTAFGTAKPDGQDAISPRVFVLRDSPGHAPRRRLAHRAPQPPDGRRPPTCA